MARWSWGSAGLGAAVWLGWLAVFAGKQGPIATLLLFAVLVLVPLALPLAATPDRAGRHVLVYRAAVYAQPAAALLVAVSFMLAPGVGAALLVTGLVALFGLWRLRRRVLPGGRAWRLGGLSCSAVAGSAAEVCLDAGLLYLPIGGVWLVVARLGMRPLDFPDVIVLLTAVHFHYAGFIAPLLAAMAGRALPANKCWARRAYRMVAAGVMAGPPLLAAGITYSPALEAAAAVLLAASIVGLSVLILTTIVPAPRPLAQRILLLISALSAMSALVLAGIYGVGAIAGERLLTIHQMAQVHGWTNALGFTLCGLLAWRLAPPAQAGVSASGARG
jgi:hypothetical protein